MVTQSSKQSQNYIIKRQSVTFTIAVQAICKELIMLKLNCLCSSQWQVKE